jgi:nucleoside-triphosphatase THEP1
MNPIIHKTIKMSDIDKLDFGGNREAYLQFIITEYDKMEKYFGTDKYGNIMYDDEKDSKLCIKHMKSGHHYIGYEGFTDWVDNQSKKECQIELNELLNPKPKKGIQASEEQSLIVEHVKNNKNIVVEAVAGSGKTTTVLFIAEALPSAKIYQITYNKQLKFEVREKVVARKIKNLQINTYHSLAVRFYNENAHDDIELQRIVKTNMKPRRVEPINVLIVDEVQDMTPDYYHFIHKFMRDMNFCGNIIILGDRYQGIYEFKNADGRFLTLGDQLYGKKTFVTLPLHESFRLTNKIAWFTNNVMLGSNRIVSHKVGKHPVYYYKRNTFSCHLEFGKLLTDYINSGYKADDIFVLAPSLKYVSVKKLENVLTEKGVPVYFSRSEDEGIDDEVIKGKVVFTTFHCAKGRERKICLVFGFDESYFDYCAKTKDRNVCPSELYVPVTRASEILIVIEDEKKNPLPFLKYSHNEMATIPAICANVRFMGKVRQNDNKNTNNKQSVTEHNTTVKELVSYLGQENIGRINTLMKKLIKTLQKSKIENTAEIPLTMESDRGFTELIGDLNGLVIPAYYESRTSLSKTSTLEANMKYLYDTSEESNKKFIDKYLKRIKTSLDSNEFAKYLCNGNIYMSLKQGLHSNLEQIDKYNWLTKPIMNICCKNLGTNVGDDALYEQKIGNTGHKENKFFRYSSKNYGFINIHNAIDCYDKHVLWEFKCVGSIQMEHILQLIVYAWIWEKCMAQKYGHRLYNILNIRTGEKINVEYKTELIEEIIEILFENKFSIKPKKTNAEFLLMCDNIHDHVSGNSDENLVEENSEDSLNMFLKPTKKNIKSVKKIMEDSENDTEDDYVDNSDKLSSMFTTSKKPTIKSKPILDKNHTQNSENMFSNFKKESKPVTKSNKKILDNQLDQSGEMVYNEDDDNIKELARFISNPKTEEKPPKKKVKVTVKTSK